MWKRGVDVLGKEGIGALIHYVGMYAYICIALNGFDSRIPEGEKL